VSISSVCRSTSIAIGDLRAPAGVVMRFSCVRVSVRVTGREGSLRVTGRGYTYHVHSVVYHAHVSGGSMRMNERFVDEIRSVDASTLISTRQIYLPRSRWSSSIVSGFSSSVLVPAVRLNGKESNRDLRVHQRTRCRPSVSGGPERSCERANPCTATYTKRRCQS
jgi:hypothetical protein